MQFRTGFMISLALAASQITALVNPCPSNPNQKCKAKDGSLYSLGDATHNCWSFINGNWHCQGSTNGVCLTGSHDTSLCKKTISYNINRYMPNLRLACPSSDNPGVTCLASDGSRAFFTRPGDYKCWSFGINGWTCMTIGVKGRCDEDQIDITKCPIGPGTCPPFDKPNTQCITPANEKATFSNPNGSNCWVKTGNTWSCQRYLESTQFCPDGEVDVTGCPIKENYSD